MRILNLNLIAAAMLILGVGSANAYNVSTHSSYNGTDILAVSDTVTLTVTFDTEGALTANNRLMLMGVGILFDDAILQYDQSASSAQYYAIGSAAAGNDLVPASTCQLNGSYPTYGPVCGLYVLPPAQIQLDYLSSAIASVAGTPTNTAVGGNLVATLVFHVIDAGDGFGEIGLVFSGARGSALTVQNRPNTSTPWTYIELTPSLGNGIAGVVTVPEPTTAVLIGLGLTGLGIAGRRRE